MIFVDANIFMYAAGRESSQKKPCLKFLDDVTSNLKMKACTNAEVLQEILHRYSSTNELQQGLKIFDLVLSLGLPVLSINVDDMKAAKQILQETPTISARDAVHLGVMQNHGISKVATYDKGFKKIAWAEVVSI